MEGASQSSQPQLCRNGCGFYGSAKTEGMCSVCYKDTLQKKNNNGRKSPAVSLPSAIKAETIASTLKEASSDSNVASKMASLATSDVPHNSKAEGGSSSPTPTTSSPTKPLATGSSPLATTMTSPIAIPSATNPATSLTSFSPPQNSSLNSSTASVEDSPSKPKKSRCASCRKRVGLTGFYCRCGKLFCGLHRYSDQHQCDFDYKADAQAKIRKENPLVVGEKIKKI